MPGNIIIKSNRIVTPGGITGGCIVVKKGKINEISDSTAIPEVRGGTGEIFDAGDNYVVPGFVDLHIHGAGGYEVMADSEEVKKLARYLAARGTTSFFATTGTVPISKLISAINGITGAIEYQKDAPEAEILGIHLEGPFVNVAEKGAFSPEFILPGSVEVMKELEEACRGHLARVTLAPEIKGGMEVTEYLREQDYLVAGGHTDASYEETMAGISAGISIANHMFNAMRGLHHRKPGAAGAYLVSEDVTCEVIGDFIHVHPGVIKMLFRSKGEDGVYLISDAVIAAGLEPGKYNFDGREIFVDSDGISRLADGTIAGSTFLLKDGLKNIIDGLGLSLEEAVRFTSENPARVANVYHRKGALAPGKDADIVVLDENYNVRKSFVMGKEVAEQNERNKYG
ncbi:MAG: N-acetylglucosamine-6-phosphate deacetylase [Bacillota bacterium]